MVNTLFKILCVVVLLNLAEVVLYASVFAEEGITISTAQIVMAAGACWGAIALMFKFLIKAKDDQIALLIAQLVTKDADNRMLLQKKDDETRRYLDLADEAVTSNLLVTNKLRQREGKPPLEVLPKVVPEGNSPPTQEQRDAARVSTLREIMAKIKRETGQEPRIEPGGEVNP